MTLRPPTKRTPPGAPGVKMLISVSALAATLGGWATFAYAEHRPVAQVISPTPTPAATLAPTEPTYISVNLATLPTVIPAPTLPKPAPTVNAPMQVVYAAPANPPPAAQAPGLRVVDAPPPPPASQPQSQPQSQSSPSDQQVSAPPPANNPPPPVTTTQSSQP